MSDIEIFKKSNILIEIKECGDRESLNTVLNKFSEEKLLSSTFIFISYEDSLIFMCYR